MTLPTRPAPSAQPPASASVASSSGLPPHMPNAPASLPPGTPPQGPRPWWLRAAEGAMALCLGVMALAVFINVVLRYGFGSGVAASEELSRLLFVWMVFIGATAAYPLGEHMAFTSLLLPMRRHRKLLMGVAALIRVAVIAAAVMVAWGAWQQVVVGMDSRSVVLGYSNALLPLPALISSVLIGLMALWELVRARPLNLDHELEVE